MRMMEEPLPDSRQHRGPHPQDLELFAEDSLPQLQAATSDLCWLFSRGYAAPSALKLVGDRYTLTRRQRLAVQRCSCSEKAAGSRRARQVTPDMLAQQDVWLDGYNVLTTLEAALSGGVILAARDGCYRDMASMHGTYRKVVETMPALQILGELMKTWQINQYCWLLDAPVSNSGRLKQLLCAFAAVRSLAWSVELVADPDVVLMQRPEIIASADSQILDSSRQWFNLARAAVDAHVRDAWIIRLNDGDDPQQ